MGLKEKIAELFDENELELIRKKMGRPGFSNYYGSISQFVDMTEKSGVHRFFLGNIMIIIEEDVFYNRLYYIWDGSDFKNLSSEVIGGFINMEKPLICDVIAKDNAGDEFGILDKLGLSLYKTYDKIQNLPPRKTFKERMEIVYAIPEECDEIYDLLYSSFDVLSDRLPSRECLMEYIKNDGIYAAHLKGELAGIYMFYDTNMRSRGDSICIKEKFQNSIVGYSLLAKYYNDHQEYKVIEGWIESGEKFEMAFRLNQMFGTKKTGERNFVYKA